MELLADPFSELPGMAQLYPASEYPVTEPILRDVADWLGFASTVDYLAALGEEHRAIFLRARW